VTADLIITNGDEAGGLLRRAFPGTEVLPWRDVLHEGPVPVTSTLEQLTEIRACYLAQRGWGDEAKLRSDLTARDRGLVHSTSFDRVIMWFEHDLYDQLQLLQLLNWFDENRREPGSLLRVQTDDYLGKQTEAAILTFKQFETPVTQPQLDLAREAWRAFRTPTPEAWHALLARDLSALPYLQSAVMRMLEELPGPDGLSRTERAMLSALERGAANPLQLFAAVQHEEEAIFMGDWSFWGLLDGLALAKVPLIAGLDAAPFDPGSSNLAQPYLRSTLSLTPFGVDVLSGRGDHAAQNTIDRWWGGTHLTKTALWRSDRERKRIIPPKN
jgi:hypothetical protein